MRMKKRENREQPGLFLNGDQPTIYRKRKRRWITVLKWTSIALAVLLLFMFVGGYLWLKSKESQMRISGVETALDPKEEGQPETTLVMGVDRGSEPGEETVVRTDILMLVSVDPEGGKAAVISIPRDTRLVIPGYEGYQKINAAHSIGGPQLAIETVRAFTGLDINHYVVIDFEGFKQIVDAIGGVPMHVDVAIHDKYAGEVPAGDVVLNGDQALTFVRARHDVNAVPAGDLDRVKNQREFLQALISTVSRQRNPIKIIRLINAVSSNIRTDLTFRQMLSLGNKLRGVEGDGLQMTTAPGEAKVIDGVWYYIVDSDGFSQLLASFKKSTEVGDVSHENQQQETDRSSVSVKVLNGTGVTGLASSVSEDLEHKGYSNVTTGNSENAYNETTIYYANGDSAMAGVIAGDLEGVEEPALKQNDAMVSEYQVDVVVVLGANYREA